MKINEFIQQETDIDVVDNVCEELYIAFCGPVQLTPEGEERFAEVLDYDIEIFEDIAVVDVDGPDDEWEDRLRKAKKLFYAMAGYCSVDDYRKWFED